MELDVVRFYYETLTKAEKRSLMIRIMIATESPESTVRSWLTGARNPRPLYLKKIEQIKNIIR